MTKAIPAMAASIYIAHLATIGAEGTSGSPPFNTIVPEVLDLSNFNVGTVSDGFHHNGHLYAQPFRANFAIRFNLQTFLAETLDTPVTWDDHSARSFARFHDGSSGYLLPDRGSIVVRFDLQSFTSVETLDLAATVPNMACFNGGFRDGSYGYLVPGGGSCWPLEDNWKIARFDLQSFSSAETLDLTVTETDQIFASGDYLWGGFSDGSHGYLIPRGSKSSGFGTVVRFDLQSFSSVETLALTDTDPDLKGFSGGFSQCGYGYLAPHANNGAAFGKVARIDLQSFSSVDALDLTFTDQDLKGFNGAFSDGKYGYLVPPGSSAGSSKLARFDLQSFSAVEFLDLSLTDATLSHIAGGRRAGGHGFLFSGSKVVRFAVGALDTTTGCSGSGSKCVKVQKVLVQALHSAGWELEACA